MTDYFRGLIEGYKRSIVLIDLINPGNERFDLNLLKQLIEAKINLYSNKEAKFTEERIEKVSKI